MDTSGVSSMVSSSRPSSRGPSVRPTSHEFAEQIRQLESEGVKLMKATNNLGDSLGVTGTSSMKSNAAVLGGSNYRATSSSLSALTDISSSEKTIAEIRSQLDAQSNEARRLQQTLRGDPVGLGPSAASSSYTNTLSALDIPPTTYRHHPVGDRQHPADRDALTLSALSTSQQRAATYVPESHLDRQLREAQEETTELRTRLREVIKLSEQQKSQFRHQIEDLKSQLQTSLHAQEKLTHSKDQVSTTSDLTVRRLQSTIDQLEQANRLQEEILLELNTKVESLQKDRYVVDSVVSQVRSMLEAREQRRGRMFYDSEPVASQSTTMLLHTLERCVQELEAEVQTKQHRVIELQEEMGKEKTGTQERLQMAAHQQQVRLDQLTAEHEKQLAVSVDRSQKTRDQLQSLQDQLAVIQSEHQEKLKSREEEIRELETKFHKATLAHEQEKLNWNEKRGALELALDQMQKEVAVCQNERDEAVQKHSRIESRFDNVEETINQLEGDLESERSNCDRLLQEKADIEREMSEVKQELNARSADVQHLQKALDDMKQEAQSQLKQTVTILEKEGKERAADQLNLLATQLNTLTDKYQQVALQHEILKGDHKRLSEKYEGMQEQNKQKAEALQGVLKEKEHFTSELKASEADLNHLRSERDLYYRTLEERTEDLSSLRAENEKLSVQLEERERSLSALQAQTDSMSTIVETNAESQRNIKEERDQLQQQLNDKIIEAEELRHGFDNLTKKLQVREKHLADMEEDNIKMAELIRDKKVELEQVTKEKDTLHSELKESRYEVAGLTLSSQKLQTALDKHVTEKKQEVHKLSHKLKSAERDLRLAHKALKAQESVDGKAVKVAGKMQRQVTEKRSVIDNLQTRLHWLEECLEASIKDKKVLQEDNGQLVGSLQQTTQQNQRLITEITNLKAENQELRDHNSRLDAALEKAAVKYAAAQAQVEQFEQDMARLKLKHQLELKEVERTGQVSKSSLGLLDGAKAMNGQGIHVGSGINTLTSALTSGSVGHSCPQPKPHTAEPDLPVRQKPTQAQVESLVAQNGVGHELRGLLDEMRALIYGQQQAQAHIQQAAKQTHRHDDKLNKESHKPTSQIDQCDLQARKKPTSSRANVPAKKKSLVTQISTSRKTTRSRGSSGRSSPVSDLLTADSWEHLHVKQTDSESVSSGLTEESDVNRGLKGLSLLPSDSAALCKRLERKIESLSRLGGHLERENKEMAAVMKDQDRKLRKIRNGDKNIQNLLRN